MTRVCLHWFSMIGFPGGSDGKESMDNVGHLGLIPGLGRSSGGVHGNPFQYSCLENPHGQMSLEGYSPWSRKELDMTGWVFNVSHFFLNWLIIFKN